MAGSGENIAPPNWIVERIPRTNKKYLGKIDWFYREPGSSTRLRSRQKAWAKYFETKNSNAAQTTAIVEVSSVVKEITEAEKKEITEAEKKEVEEFLEEAWMNLVNMDKK